MELSLILRGDLVLLSPVPLLSFISFPLWVFFKLPFNCHLYDYPILLRARLLRNIKVTIISGNSEIIPWGEANFISSVGQWEGSWDFHPWAVKVYYHQSGPWRRVWMKVSKTLYEELSGYVTIWVIHEDIEINQDHRII